MGKMCYSPSEGRCSPLVGELPEGKLHWFSAYLGTVHWSVQRAVSVRIVMERMKEVFLNLKQGNDNVNTYIRNFMNLSRYGGDEISDDKKKQKMFRQGLNASIKYDTCKAGVFS